MGSWSNPPEDPIESATRIAVRGFADGEMAWPARLHYWSVIHGDDPRREPHRVLVVHTFDWMVGKNLYFVPVQHKDDLDRAVVRHNVRRSGYAHTHIYRLTWSEFTRLFPRPDLRITRND